MKALLLAAAMMIGVSEAALVADKQGLILETKVNQTGNLFKYKYEVYWDITSFLIDAVTIEVGCPVDKVHSNVDFEYTQYEGGITFNFDAGPNKKIKFWFTSPDAPVDSWALLEYGKPINHLSGDWILAPDPKGCDVIPEPSTLILGAFTGLVILNRRRR